MVQIEQRSIEQSRQELAQLEGELRVKSEQYIQRITSNEAENPALSFESVYFAYDKRDGYVINGLSFAVPKGAGITGLLGPSGSGKSTILRLIGGFQQPDAGIIRIDGEIVASSNRSVPPEKRNVGFMFQDYALFPHLTVAKNIQFGLNKWKRADKDERLVEMLRFVGLESFGNRMPHELSGGQMQRVALARSLAPNPKILLMDEPFSNMDQALKADVRQEVGELIRSKGIPTILVTHDIDDVTKMASRVIQLNVFKQ